MPASFTSTGLTIPTAAEIKTELETAFKDFFGNSIDLDPSGPFGQLVGIMAAREADLWEIIAAVKEARNPDGAVGLQLDELCALTGTVRDGAAKSAVTVTMVGDDLTFVPAGSLMSTDSTGVQFATDDDVTLAAPDAWQALTNYVVNTTVASTGNVFRALTGGTSGNVAISGTETNVVDGSVLWRNIGEGAAYGDVIARSVETGGVVALADDLIIIDSPVTGWTSVVNLDDALVGYDQESDASLRVKREIELFNSLGPTSGGFIEYISNIEDVTQVYVFENNSAVTDVDGIPSNAFETLVVGGDDDDIAEAIFAAKPLGIQAYGNTSVTVYDSQGSPQSIGFSRPTPVNVFVNVTIIADPHDYPENGDTQVRDAILTLDETTVPGKDVVSSKIKALCHGVPGVLDVPTAYIGLSSSANKETTIAISIRQIAAYASNRITVTSTTGTP